MRRSLQGWQGELFEWRRIPRKWPLVVKNGGEKGPLHSVFRKKDFCPWDNVYWVPNTSQNPAPFFKDADSELLFVLCIPQVEIIANDQGNRITPSYVSFSETERLVGDAAKNQVRENMNYSSRIVEHTNRGF